MTSFCLGIFYTSVRCLISGSTQGTFHNLCLLERLHSGGASADSIVLSLFAGCVFVHVRAAAISGLAAADDAHY